MDDEGAGDLLQSIEEDTKRRAANAVVRVEVERAMPASASRRCCCRSCASTAAKQLLALGDDDVYEVGEPLDPTVLKELASLPLPICIFRRFSRATPSPRPVPCSMRCVSATGSCITRTTILQPRCTA
jgi:polyphosphate kinase